MKKVWSRRWLAAPALVIVVIVGVIGWRWQRAHALVGTEVAAELTVGMCFNSLFWTAPDGSRWWAGHDPVVAGEWVSEPARLLADPRNASGGSYIDNAIGRRTVGVVHFDDVDHATFTSRTGGTVAFERDLNTMYTADCQGVPSDPLPPATGPYAVAFQGALAQSDPSGAGEPVLVPGTVRALVEGKVIAEAPAVGGRFVIYVPALGPITITGDIGQGECDTYTTTIYSGVPDWVPLVCP